MPSEIMQHIHPRAEFRKKKHLIKPNLRVHTVSQSDEMSMMYKFVRWKAIVQRRQRFKSLVLVTKQFKFLAI